MSSAFSNLSLGSAFGASSFLSADGTNLSSAGCAKGASFTSAGAGAAGASAAFGAFTFETFTAGYGFPNILIALITTFPPYITFTHIIKQ